MQSHTTERFRKAFNSLPSEVQLRARKTYRLWQSNSNHPGLHFKKIHEAKPIYSVRIGSSYRAVGLKKDDAFIWFWIGSHEEYNNLISSL